MWKLLKTGFNEAWSQPFAVCLLFIYNLLWGVLVYALISSLVVPLLHRYPSPELPNEAVQLFWLEGQFQLMKTDFIYPYLWWALALILVRLFMTPLLSAGVYYSLEHKELNAGYRFIQGIRRLAPSFILLHAIQWVLIAAPLYMLIPKLIAIYSSNPSLGALAWQAAPWLGCYLLYLLVQHPMFMYVQFGFASGTSTASSLRLFARNLLPIMLLAVITGISTLAITAAVLASAFMWAGFAALVGIQAYRLLQVFSKLWMITSQRTLWNATIE